jgi:diadenosine tetraphosphate (Ap4A) HIT family hydrolase
MPVSGLPPYDDANVFARILRGEIPNKTVYEDAWVLAFHDIGPQAPTHVLVIPKGAYVSFADFSAKASDAEIAGFMRAVGKVAQLLGLEAPGYRLIANMGEHSGQEVPHFHIGVRHHRRAAALGHELVELGLVLRLAQPLQIIDELPLLLLQPPQRLGAILVERGITARRGIAGARTPAAAAPRRTPGTALGLLRARRRIVPASATLHLPGAHTATP